MNSLQENSFKDILSNENNFEDICYKKMRDAILYGYGFSRISIRDGKINHEYIDSKKSYIKKIDGCTYD